MVALLALSACGARIAAAQDANAVADNPGRDCQEGVVLRPGEGCVYPGTDKPFDVGADGSATFLFGAFGGSIDIDGEFDGRRYDLAATEESGGVWRIERMDVEAKLGAAGAPLALIGLDCRGESSAAGMTIRIEGAVHARAGVSSVMLTGRVDGELVDVISLGRLSAYDTAPFLLQGHAPLTPGEFDCAVDVLYFNVSALRRDPPLRVKGRGRVAQ